MAEIVAERHGGSGRPMLDLAAASGLTQSRGGRIEWIAAGRPRRASPARDRRPAPRTCSATQPTSRSTTGRRSPSGASDPSRASRPTGSGPRSAARCPSTARIPARSSTRSSRRSSRASSRWPHRATSASSSAGRLPAALAVDWLTATWDQNSVLYLATPAASVVEEVAAGWLVELLGLPAGSSVGFTTSATMANFTGLAAARHAVLRSVGWDAEEDGLVGAPPIHVVVGERRPRLDAERDPDGRAGAAAGDPDRHGRRGPAPAGRAPASPRRAAGRTDDRVRPGRRGEHRRVRSVRRDRRRADRPAGQLAPRRRGVRPVGRGRPVAPGVGWPGSTGPTRGAPTPTSGSTCPTTPGSSSSATWPRTGRRWARPRPTCRRLRAASAIRWTTCRR